MRENLEGWSTVDTSPLARVEAALMQRGEHSIEEARLAVAIARDQIRMLRVQPAPELDALAEELDSILDTSV